MNVLIINVTKNDGHCVTLIVFNDYVHHGLCFTEKCLVSKKIEMNGDTTGGRCMLYNFNKYNIFNSIVYSLEILYRTTLKLQAK